MMWRVPQPSNPMAFPSKAKVFLRFDRLFFLLSERFIGEEIYFSPCIIRNQFFVNHGIMLREGFGPFTG